MTDSRETGLPLTDRLARERTSLATERTRMAYERTALAYARTALMMVVSGVTLIKLVGGMLMIAFGWLFIAGGAVLGLFGIRRYAAMESAVRQSAKHPPKAANRK